jgi:4-amino-4-deoxy-L-arabinose transferase-like glycosyltransferase
MYNLIFGPALFYDIPEYLQIVRSHSFWQVFSLGHFPIHPFFLGILWILIKFIPVNAVAMVFGIISIFIFYKISKLIFKKGPFWLATVVFALFPAVWIINTNLMVESVTLTFYLASLYFFLSKRINWFFISLFLMVGTHLESIFWIPTIFLFPFIFGIKFEKKEIFKFVKTAVLSILISILLYVLIYYFSHRVISGQGEQLATYFSSGILRMIRNAWLSFIRDYGTLTPFILLFLLIKNVKTKTEWISWAAFFLITFIIGANWQGDFMGRRIIFAAVLPALALYKYLGRKTFFVILYLLPIVAANIILYSGGSPFTPPQIPTGQVLVETHYLAPFTKYEGTILWIGEDDLGKIDGYLKSGKKVFLSSQAVTAPYLLLVGNNYHITSLGKAGDSESRFLFQKYVVESYNNVFELKLYQGKVSSDAGQPVIFFDQSFWGRLARRRIDYGDIGSWIWTIITNHRDPTGWTYKDVRGIWYNM